MTPPPLHIKTYIYLLSTTELMMNKLLLLSFLFIYFGANGQSVLLADSVKTFGKSELFQKDIVYTIGGINIIGNKKTKAHIILREMAFKTGDSISGSALQQNLIHSKEMVFNTSLFVDDSVYVSEIRGHELFISVLVKERWYIFPLPYLTFVDRNFNTWWVQENHSLDRINYGIKFIHQNFTGENDKMNVWLINGYTQQITLRYDLPFMNKSLTKGMNIGYTYARQHEVNYGTSATNKELFFDYRDEFIQSYTKVDFTYSYRPNQKIREYFRVSYTDQWVADTILKLNPSFFPLLSNHAHYIDFGYYFRYYNMDYNFYPTKGYYGEAFIYKRGITGSNNLWQIGVRGIYIQPLLKKTFLNIEAAATLKFPKDNSFLSQALFGYGYYNLRGMEYYVVDGMSGVLGKFTLQQPVFKYVLKNPVKSRTHDKIPFSFYLKTYSDLGYCGNPYTSTKFNNILMHTWGAGLDVVSIYDFVFRFEYSVNQFGEHGIFLHVRSSF